MVSGAIRPPRAGAPGARRSPQGSESDQPAPTVADVITPPEEAVQQSDPPSEPNLAQQRAPNEANSHVQAPSRERGNGHTEHRIDTPHVDRKRDGIGTTRKETLHPAIQRLQTGRESTLMNLSSIFGGP